MGTTLRVCATVITSISVVLNCGSANPALAKDTRVALSEDWQTSATGLLGQPRESKSTAGLAFTMWQEGWPNLTLPGGVRDGETYQPSILGPVRIDMGEINVPDATGTFVSERADWSMNESVFAYGDQQLKITTSRLTPAVLIQSPATALNLFAGNMPTYRFDGTKVNAMGDAPSYPKYVAFGGDNGAAIRLIGAQPTAVPANTRWLLVWYGDQSHFVDTRKPLSYINLAASNAYQADAPMLVLFQSVPTQLQRGAQGGVQLTFGAASGDASRAISLMPLYGRQTLPVTQTEAWGAALPADVLQRANAWATRQCQFPLTAREDYVYDEFSDRASVTERFTYQPVCAGAQASVPFAPLPPMLALAKDTLGVRVEGTLIGDALATEFGPLTGIENASGYTWSMAGLADVVRARRAAGNGTVPPELQQELVDQVQGIVQAGHLRPWIFIDGVPRHTERGDLYWANPADTLIHLSQAALALPDGAGRNALVNYLRNERAQFPPETQFNLGLQDGAVRPGYTGYWDDWEFQWTQGRADAIQKRVPLWNAYALSQVADVMEEAPSGGTMQALSVVLDAEMRERDWATMYWFEGFQDRSVAVVNANRHFAGLLGYARLATRLKDTAARQLALPLLAKAAVLRAGMALYPRYLYAAQLQELPAQADWQVQQTAGTWNGYLFNTDWRTGDDDARQVTFLNQFGVYLYDHSGTEGGDASACCFPHPYLTAYRDLTPELAQLLGKLGPVAQVYANKVKALFPLWYASFAEGTLGHEHNLSHPVDAFQIFLAEAYLKQASGDELVSYIDIPYVQTGDLFYVQKLAETVLAYRGVTWQGGGVQVAAQPLPDRMADKGEQVRFAVSVRPSLEPVTETVLISISVPSGLQYHAGSLQAEAGAVNDSAAPLLTWQGPLPTNDGVTMHFDVAVQEAQPRWLDVDVWIESPPGQTRLITTSLVVNPIGLYLPVAIR